MVEEGVDIWRARSVEWTDELVAAAQAEAASARATFDRTLGELRTSVTGLDGAEVLARAAFALLAQMSSLGARPEREGIEVFHVELLQALALSADRRPAHPDDDYPAVSQSIIDSIDENGRAYRKLWMARLTNDRDANRREQLIGLLQGWTMAVRGARHQHQTREYLIAMAEAVEGPFRQAHRCDPRDVVTALLGLFDLIGDRIEARRRQMRDWLRRSTGHAMIEAFARGMDEDAARRVREAARPHRGSRERVRSVLWALAEPELLATLTISFDELTAPLAEAARVPVRAILETLALAFGEVGEQALQHLHMDNPVRLRPLVRLDADRVACFNVFSLGANLAEVFEAICARHGPTKAKAEKARAEWLEMKVGALMRRHLPHASTHRQARWVDPADGRAYENDVVALVDRTVLILEAKSGRIAAPARRGALNSLRNALNDLVVSPSEQSWRLKRRIETADGPITLHGADGEFVIDPATVRDVVRVNVLLDAVGPLSAHWPQLKEAGLLPVDAEIAPTMSVFELETVFEVLRSEIERCHYLSRRTRFEREADWVADELDLLAFYIETQFNLDDTAFYPDLRLYGWSARIAYAYAEKRASDEQAFAIKRTELWSSLLRELERRRPGGWTRFGHRLLSVPLVGQKAFGRAVKQGWRDLTRSPTGFVTQTMTIGRDARRHAIAFVIANDASDAEFEERIAQAANGACEHGDVSDALVIGWRAPATGEPYDFIGVLKRRRVAASLLASL